MNNMRKAAILGARRGWAACWLAAVLVLVTLASPAPARDLAWPQLNLEVRFTPDVRSSPFTGRILVFTGPAEGREPRMGPNWFSPAPFFALDVTELRPGEVVTLNQYALGFPSPPGAAPEIATRYQAVLDQDRDYPAPGLAPGNGVSAPVLVGPDTERVRLVMDRVLPARPFPESERVRLVEILSPRLSRFEGRPTRMRAGVLLPKGYDADPQARFPVVYVVTGFGGDHYSAAFYQRLWPQLSARDGLNAAVVVLDATAYTGHHVFADSANNGPVGTALVKELIPHLEKSFRFIPRPEARLLTGHSSGGWSTLWLQYAYPETFGGVWATSPDPVDFRDFQRVDLYAPGANLFTDPEGKPRPIARRGETPVLFYRPFSDMETVLGHGGQLQSFEAVFSPRAKDGRPLPLYDRRTGAVDPAAARAWRKYDLNLLFRQDWKKLRKKLAGRLHVYTGEKDTFYLEGAVQKLKATLAELGSDAVMEIHPGKDHGSLLDAPLRERIAREMAERLRAGGIGKAGL